MSSNLENVTNSVLAQISKAQTVGISTDTGITSYDLTGVVTLIPVVTPFRTSVGRVASPNGNKFAVWRAILNLTNTQPNPAPGFDYAANEVNVDEHDFTAEYKAIGYAGKVTQDAYDLARGLGYDPYAQQTFMTLNQLLIAEDRLLIGGQNFALTAPVAPTLVAAANGTIVAGTYTIGVAARTGAGYFYGGNSQGATRAITTVSTGSIVASTDAVRGAVAYDWFFAGFYVATTTVSSYEFKVAAVANATPVGVDLSSWAPTLNTGADNGSANANSFNGLIATLSGDYSATGAWVKVGTGTANPSVFIDNKAAALTLAGSSIAQIEELFAQVYANVKTSPTRLLVSARTAQSIANLILSSTSAVTFLQTASEGRTDITAGGKIGHLVNTPAGGVVVPLEIHPNLPAGTIVAVTDRVPFPNSGINNTLEVRTLRDYAQFDYGISRVEGVSGGGPRKEFEIRSVETLINYAPVAMGVLTNVA